MADITNYCYELLAQDMIPDCKQLPKGFLPDGIILNWDDIDHTNSGDPSGYNGTLTALPLKSGAKGYSIKQLGLQPFNGSTITLNAPTANLGGTATASVSFRVPQNSPAVTSGFIDKLLNGRFVVILQRQPLFTRFTNGSEPEAVKGSFPVYGAFQGLRLSEGSMDPYSDETGGGWTITLTEAESPVSGAFLWDGSYSLTKTLFDSLLVTAASE